MTTYREVVQRTIEFRSPPWVPYHIAIVPDELLPAFGHEAVACLRAGLEELGVCPEGPVYVDQPLFVGVHPEPTRLPDPYRPLQGDEWVDEWGVIWACRQYPRVVGHPLEVDWSLAADYALPDPHAPGRYAQAHKRLVECPDRYRLGHVWFSLFERLWFLRGFDNMLVDPYLYPREFQDLGERIVAFNLASIEEQLALGIDGIFFSDDWGTQESLLMNPNDWRRWYKPWYQRMFAAVRKGGAHVWMHLCGNIMTIIPDLIEIGLNVLNPVQPQAMNVQALATSFGGQVCFYGGADVQGTLPHGTPADVDREVRWLIDTLGRFRGGYIGSTSHGILADTPPENVLALFGAFRRYSQQE